MFDEFHSLNPFRWSQILTRESPVVCVDMFAAHWLA